MGFALASKERLVSFDKCNCWVMLDTKLSSISDVKSLVGFTVAVSAT